MRSERFLASPPKVNAGPEARFENVEEGTELVRVAKVPYLHGFNPSVVDNQSHDTGGRFDCIDDSGDGTEGQSYSFLYLAWNTFAALDEGLFGRDWLEGAAGSPFSVPDEAEIERRALVFVKVTRRMQVVDVYSRRGRLDSTLPPQLGSTDDYIATRQWLAEIRKAHPQMVGLQYVGRLSHDRCVVLFGDAETDKASTVDLRFESASTKVEFDIDVGTVPLSSTAGLRLYKAYLKARRRPGWEG